MMKSIVARSTYTTRARTRVSIRTHIVVFSTHSSESESMWLCLWLLFLRHSLARRHLRQIALSISALLSSSKISLYYFLRFSILSFSLITGYVRSQVSWTQSVWRYLSFILSVRLSTRPECRLKDRAISNSRRERVWVPRRQRELRRGKSSGRASGTGGATLR